MSGGILDVATPWDDSMKLLISENAQDFVSWLMEGAVVEEQLKTEFEGRKLIADALLLVIIKGIRWLLHIEVQAEHDPDMPRRLVEYNMRARREYNLPVDSVVIYMHNHEKVHQSPWQLERVDGGPLLNFYYGSIELRKMAAIDLRELGLPGIVPLMILTKDGATREVADEIFTELERTDNQDSMAPAYVMASLAFGKHNLADQSWLLRRLKNMHNSLRDTPVYQEMTRMAREEGFETGHKEGQQQGRQEGLQQGLQQNQHQMLHGLIMDIILQRFPALVVLAEKKSTAIKDPAILRNILLKLSIAQSAQEVESYMNQIPEEGV